MGMVLNRFGMLKQVREDMNRGRGLANRFCLSAVIVHDIKDKKLRDCMRKNFERWSQMTGENFLFITFVRPSEAWKMSPYANDKYCVDNNYLMAERDATKEDEETTVDLLRSYMCLPKMGSYMMLTEDLASNSFYKIPVTAEAIEEQLHLITRYCEKEALGRVHGPADIKALIAELEAEVYLHTCPFIDVLLDVTSISSRVLSQYGQNEQKDRAESVVKELKCQLGEYDDEGYEDRLIQMYEVIKIVHKNGRVKRQPSLRSSYKSAHAEFGFICATSEPANIKSNDSIDEGLKDSKKWLDEYSKKLLDTHDMFAKIVDDVPNIDYSGLTLYQGKIMEYETNLSIGQLLRYVMGIDMPEYYNMYCAGKRNVFIPAGRNTVNVNQYDGSPDDYSPLRSVSLGSLAFAYNDMRYDQGEYPYIPIWDRFVELDEDMIEFLIDFSSYRNPAAHIDANSERTYMHAKEGFDKFMKLYLPMLYDVKQHLQSVRKRA